MARSGSRLEEPDLKKIVSPLRRVPAAAGTGMSLGKLSGLAKA